MTLASVNQHRHDRLAAITPLTLIVALSHPDRRATNGLGPPRAMLQSLLNWSHFDPYYFDKLRKLDRSAAHRNLEHLRQLREIRDAKIKADRERRAAQEAVHQQPTASLEQLRAEYLDLLANKTSRQQRGYALERILAELSRLSHLETTEAFRVVGEQVDGAVKFDGEQYGNAVTVKNLP